MTKSKLMKLDPSRTSLLRRSFVAEMKRKFQAVIRAVTGALIEDDAFGLGPSKSPLATNVEKQVWRFLTDDQKLTAFNKWFDSLVKSGILNPVDAKGKSWTANYVESAYRKGALRAYFDANPALASAPEDFYKGSQQQFLQSTFGQPEKMSKIKLIATRTYEELKGITSVMSQQISRVLADGLAHGKNPHEVARLMSKTITGISRQRAEVLARTEIISAHAEGQLDSFEALGIEEVGVMAEWLTAGDLEVCDECEELEGVVMSVEEARGLLPRHPNCRCAWIPTNVGEDTTGQLWDRDAKQAMAASIQAERPGSLFKRAKSMSTWAGKELIGRTRPSTKA